MNKLAAVCCYYGKLPNYFYLWEESVKTNSFIDFFLVTDEETAKDIVYPLPDNLKIMLLPFGELKKRIQSLYRFKISLSQPYKLCDYKFAYGEIFHSELADYDFFGWYDIDVIQGDMKKFITDDAYKCDMIGDLGHLSFMRTSLYRFYRESARSTNLSIPYKKVFTTDISCYFDEFWGLHNMRDELNIYRLNRYVADILPFNREFYSPHCESDKKFIIRYDGKRVIKVFDDGHEAEAMYVHLQKRSFTIAEGVTPNGYYITPEGFSLSPEYGEGDETPYKENGKRCNQVYHDTFYVFANAKAKKLRHNHFLGLFKRGQRWESFKGLLGDIKYAVKRLVMFIKNVICAPFSKDKRARIKRKIKKLFHRG